MIPVILCLFGFAIQGLHDYRLMKGKEAGPFLMLGCAIVLASGLVCFTEGLIISGKMAVIWALVIAFSAIGSAIMVDKASPSSGFALNGKKRLICKGVYGVCRHPAFWPFAFAAIAVAHLTGNYIWSVLAIVCEFATIFIQDKYIFGKYIADYDVYQKEVPFLIPKFGKGKNRKDNHASGEKA